MNATTPTQGGATTPPAADPAPPPAERFGVSRTALIAFCVLVATALQITRQPGVSSLDTIWAEDGGIFLNGAINQSFLEALGEPLGSYLHLAPRLINEIVSVFPLGYAAALITTISAFVVALLGLYVYVLTGELFRTQGARLALAVTFVLLPAAGYETNANTINLHWYLIFVSFLVLVTRPQTTRGIALGAVVVGFATMSDPLTGLLLPLAAWWLWEQRTWRAAIIPAVLVAGLIVQFGVATAQQPLGNPPWELVDLPNLYALRVAAGLLVGDAYLDEFWMRYGFAFAYGCLAVVAVFCAYGVARSPGRDRILLLAALVYSAVVMAAPLIVRGTEGFFLDPFNLNGSRYFLVPILLLALVVIKILDTEWTRPAGASMVSLRRRRTAAACLAIFGAGVLMSSFGANNVRSGGPRWGLQLDAARALCRDPDPPPPTPNGPPPRFLPGTDVVAIPVAPPIEPPPFVVKVDCERLR